MEIVKPCLTFEQYLNYDNDTDDRYELVDGALIALPPESEQNDFLAVWLQFELAKLIGLRLVKAHTCEIQVRVLKKGDSQNRFPDLVVLREEHLALTQKRLTITIEMPPPQLVVEVLSPGKNNRERDFNRKRSQYCDRGIPEYWLIDPEFQTITVLKLESDHYVELGQFRSGDHLLSELFSALPFTVDDMFVGV